MNIHKLEKKKTISKFQLSEFFEFSDIAWIESHLVSNYLPKKFPNISLGLVEKLKCSSALPNIRYSYLIYSTIVKDTAEYSDLLAKGKIY